MTLNCMGEIKILNLVAVETDEKFCELTGLGRNVIVDKVIVDSIFGSIQFIVIVIRYCYGIANVKTGKDRGIVVK